MIGKLASKTAESFIKNPNSCYDKIEIYQYGFFILYSNIFFFLITIILGAVLNVFLSSIFFFIAFFSIRQYAGGYHAKTETRCEIISTLSILACIIVIRLAKTYDFLTVLLIISAVSAVSIFVFCPLDTPEKRLSKSEVKYFRKISWLILSVIIAVVVISFAFKFKMLLVPCCISLIFENILIVAGKIKKVSKNNSVKA